MTGKIPAVVIGFFTKNIGLKLFSVFCALGLWFYVLAGKITINYFPGSLPVRVKNVPTGLAAIYTPQKIRVKLRASPDILVRLGIDNFNTYADLAGLGEGTHEVDIYASVNLSNVTVIEKTPSTMLVRLEPIVKKEIPIKVVFRGQARRGFVPALPRVNPDKAEVIGPKSLIDDISELPVPIELTGENRDFRKRVTFSQTGIEFAPKSVEVFVSIVPSSGTKTVGVIVKTKGQPKANYYVSQIECSPAIVEISSSMGSLQSVTDIETEEIDIEGLGENLEKEVGLSIPSGIMSREQKVRVKITLTLNTIERLIVASFNYKLNPGLRVASIDPVKVYVSGPANLINNPALGKATVFFDLTGEEAGTHLVEITNEMISVPNDCTAASWLPSSVTIILEKH